MPKSWGIQFITLSLYFSYFSRLVHISIYFKKAAFTMPPINKYFMKIGYKKEHRTGKIPFWLNINSISF